MQKTNESRAREQRNDERTEGFLKSLEGTDNHVGLANTFPPSGEKGWGPDVTDEGRQQSTLDD